MVRHGLQVDTAGRWRRRDDARASSLPAPAWRTWTTSTRPDSMKNSSGFSLNLARHSHSLDGVSPT
jgi:hypothetical protein